MISPEDARQNLHKLIDAMPDEQVALVWMTFQTMFKDETGEDYSQELQQIQENDELDEV